jgi:hypothetical protein
MARREKDQDKRRGLYQDVTVIADKLAPYRYPRLASIHTSKAKESVLDRTGITEREVFAEFIAELAKNPQVPLGIRNYIEAGLANRNGGLPAIGNVKKLS